MTRYANRFLNTLQIAGWISRVYILVLLLRPVVLRKRQEAPRKDIERIFSLHGNHSTAALAIQTDKHHLMLAEGRGLAAYATKGAVAIACGDPMSSPEDFPVVVKAFNEHCIRHGWTPSIYLACRERLAVYHDLGFASQQTAEEGIIDLTSWNSARVRQTDPLPMNVVRYERSSAPSMFLDEQLEEVTEDWLQARHIGEMGFTIGHFALESLSAGPVFLLSSPDRIEAFCAWLPYKNGEAMALDLMRQRRTAPAKSAEWIVGQSLRMLQEAGVREASLSTVSAKPSSQVVGNPVDRGLLNTFEPRWESRFLVYPRGAAVARINLALAAVQFGRFR